MMINIATHLVADLGDVLFEPIKDVNPNFEWLYQNIHLFL
jgi:hypothetical protein